MYNFSLDFCDIGFQNDDCADASQERQDHQEDATPTIVDEAVEAKLLLVNDFEPAWLKLRYHSALKSVADR